MSNKSAQRILWQPAQSSRVFGRDKMQPVPSEFVIGEVYFPPMLIAGMLGVVAAWLTALLLNRYRLSRFFAYPPLVPLALAVTYTVVIATFVMPA
jgi:hypothetical protein